MFIWLSILIYGTFVMKCVEEKIVLFLMALSESLDILQHVNIVFYKNFDILMLDSTFLLIAIIILLVSVLRKRMVRS